MFSIVIPIIKYHQTSVKAVLICVCTIYMNLTQNENDQCLACWLLPSTHRAQPLFIVKSAETFSNWVAIFI